MNKIVEASCLYLKFVVSIQWHLISSMSSILFCFGFLFLRGDKGGKSGLVYVAALYRCTCMIKICFM